MILIPVHFHECEYYMFSNFSSFSILFEGERWMTAEHAYQASKFTDPDIRLAIRLAPSAHDAKVVSHSFDTSKRSDWLDIKLAVMESIVRAKFEQYPLIRHKLLETGDRPIIENSPADAYWGMLPDGSGENHSGKIWMSLRDELSNNPAA